MGLGLVLSLLSLGALADLTNNPTAPEPVKLDETAFRIVSERNIFNANRSGGTVRSPSSKRPVRVEMFALVGTMNYEKGTFAFFEGSSSEFTKALKTGGVIAGYKVVDILAAGVKLEIDGQVTEIPIGGGLRREDQGMWKFSESVAVANSGGAGESNGRANRNDRGRRGDASDSERNGRRGSESASLAAPAATSTADQNEILKRLMERREKESQ